MLPFTLSNVRALIDEYLAAHPDGTAVTAFVLSRLGRASVETHARAAGITPGRANQEVGATVRELLLRKHPEAERLEEVPVNAAHWPELADWVTAYTAHRVPRATQAAGEKKSL